MRSIKFRAWDERRSLMLNGTKNPDFIIIGWSGEVFPMYTSSDITGEYYSNADLQNEDFQDDITLMQFTGLLDKNGVEIYEGDVVKAKRHNFEDYEICVIIYRPISFVFEVQSDKGNYIAPRNYHQHFEVIGNIYEHPHLLEVKDES
jgi:uncharacterized phage protein (TIGR01671 family)